jgi:hypothetical protein
MSIHRARRAAFVYRLLWLCSAGLQIACDLRPQEVTSVKPYADLIGTEYRVVADDVYAYGIYGNWPDKTVTEVTLIPGPGISGYEIAFRRHVPKSAVIRIVGAWRLWTLFGHRSQYTVMLEDFDVPSDAPVLIELGSTRNGGEGVELNPAVYRRMRSDR